MVAEADGGGAHGDVLFRLEVVEKGTTRDHCRLADFLEGDIVIVALEEQLRGFVFDAQIRLEALALAQTHVFVVRLLLGADVLDSSAFCW